MPKLSVKSFLDLTTRSKLVTEDELARLMDKNKDTLEQAARSA